MQKPLQIAYHGVEKSARIDALIREQASRLEEVCENITGCRVTVERPHRKPSHVSGYEVRIDLTVPPHKEVVVRRKAIEPRVRDDLYGLILHAFEAARRQLDRLTDKRRGEVKRHPDQEVEAVVSKLFEGYGFLMTAEGREVYFHQNSLLDVPFEDLSVGTGVHFAEETGDEGPQATTVRVIEPRPRLTR